MPSNSELMSVAEVAELFHVDVKTVRRWLRAGRLRGLKLATGKGASPWRIPRAEVEAMWVRAVAQAQGQDMAGAHPAVLAK